MTNPIIQTDISSLVQLIYSSTDIRSLREAAKRLSELAAPEDQIAITALVQLGGNRQTIK